MIKISTFQNEKYILFNVFDSNTNILLKTTNLIQNRKYSSFLVSGSGRFIWWKKWRLIIPLDSPFKQFIVKAVVRFFAFFLHRLLYSTSILSPYSFTEETSLTFCESAKIDVNIRWSAFVFAHRWYGQRWVNA